MCGLWCMAFLLSLWATPTQALAADHMSAEEVRSAVAAAPAGTVDLSGQGHERR